MSLVMKIKIDIDLIGFTWNIWNWYPVRFACHVNLIRDIIQLLAEFKYSVKIYHIDIHVTINIFKYHKNKLPLLPSNKIEK